MSRRSYGQLCALARALDAVGDRWTLLVVRELLFGPRRFGEIAQALKGIGPNLLSARLKALVAEGIVKRVAARGGAGYDLDDGGRALEPVLLGLARWELSRSHTPNRELQGEARTRWGIFALRARFSPEAARGVAELYAIEVDDQAYRLRVEDGALDVTAGRDPKAAVLLQTDEAVLGRLALGALALERAAESGLVAVQGSPFAAARFARIFALEGEGAAA